MERIEEISGKKMDGICGVMAANMTSTGILKRHIPFI